MLNTFSLKVNCPICDESISAPLLKDHLFLNESFEKSCVYPLLKKLGIEKEIVTRRTHDDVLRELDEIKQNYKHVLQELNETKDKIKKYKKRKLSIGDYNNYYQVKKGLDIEFDSRIDTFLDSQSYTSLIIDTPEKSFPSSTLTPTLASTSTPTLASTSTLSTSTPNTPVQSNIKYIFTKTNLNYNVDICLLNQPIKVFQPTGEVNKCFCENPVGDAKNLRFDIWYKEFNAVLCSSTHVTNPETMGAIKYFIGIGEEKESNCTEFHWDVSCANCSKKCNKDLRVKPYGLADYKINIFNFCNTKCLGYWFSHDHSNKGWKNFYDKNKKKENSNPEMAKLIKDHEEPIQSKDNVNDVDESEEPNEAIVKKRVAPKRSTRGKKDSSKK